ncbi:2'-5' RNA ligase family protein [Phycicoccus sp. MAQZ13P-2]|uniref:2'-5' RNA ligase family protein n=1 Tax=Phycicoccus mangrovi TaxID=2840470 RepID=UPI001C0013E8|nr:2'-5' RNA ligase family protein [Phycicoccus mangrovi]MBT9257640.1 2'-5' RNA ligase family protein [Phycicoccus mangrovi]MBT9276079.1 2'-5' RNA ligase family protein [Phycicoccus mangrovi]
MHSVELLLDDAGDAAVVAEWSALADAGLPSQAQHRGASNRPHVTLVTSDGWPGREAVADALACLPLPTRLGAPIVFGRGPFVLARLVVVTDGLLGVHAALARLVAPVSSPLVEPGRWVPHVTLGRRLSSSQVGEALALLGDGPGEVVFEAARHWDSVARETEELTPPRGPAGARSVDG